MRNTPTCRQAMEYSARWQTRKLKERVAQREHGIHSEVLRDIVRLFASFVGFFGGLKDADIVIIGLGLLELLHDEMVKVLAIVAVEGVFEALSWCQCLAV